MWIPVSVSRELKNTVRVPMAGELVKQVREAVYPKHQHFVDAGIRKLLAQDRDSG